MKKTLLNAGLAIALTIGFAACTTTTSDNSGADNVESTETHDHSDGSGHDELHGTGEGQHTHDAENVDENGEVNATSDTDTDKAAYYCPMKCEGDKTYADKDAKCAKCGMDLVQVEKETEDADGHDHDHEHEHEHGDS